MATRIRVRLNFEFSHNYFLPPVLPASEIPADLQNGLAAYAYMAENVFYEFDRCTVSSVIDDSPGVVFNWSFGKFVDAQVLMGR